MAATVSAAILDPRVLWESAAESVFADPATMLQYRLVTVAMFAGTQPQKGNVSRPLRFTAVGCRFLTDDKVNIRENTVEIIFK